ncbi:MAG TPA: hypothetical protein VLD62_10335 [Acidimicrobiia bacterium]|nr:hypothetical protein [Acidimicrobiia bacterium]
MVDPTPVTPRHRAALAVALIVGLPLVLSLIGLFTVGPFGPDDVTAIPTDCGVAFVDEAPPVSGRDRGFAEIARVRVFDCGDRFVAVVDGGADASATFTTGAEGDRAIASVSLIDEFGDLHERRVVDSADGALTLTSQRRTGPVEEASLDQVGFEGPSVVVVFPRGRGEDRLGSVEVGLTRQSDGVTVHDDVSVEV